MTICSTPDCEKVGTMSCPTCTKIGVPDMMSSFCAQSCFKAYWSQHKSLHKMFTTSAVETTTPWENSYAFTGPLRPGKVTAQKTMPDSIMKPDYATSTVPISEEEADKRIIPVYTAAQIVGIREACQAGRAVLDIAGNAIKVGMTTDELDVIVHEACIQLQCYPSPLNYYGFPKTLCTSVNEIICHGIPDTRPLEDGDVLNLDITVYKNGYHGDLNETFLVGAASTQDVLLVQTAFACLKAGLEMVKPGVMYRDLGKKISAVATAQGFSVVKSYCGHGIGSLFHTSPNIPHYAKNKAVGIMKAGHIFTIEPMINVGSWRDTTWGDKWSASTADGSRSAQFEHTILVTETGYEILTARKEEPHMKWSLSKVQRPLLN